MVELIPLLLFMYHGIMSECMTIDASHSQEHTLPPPACYRRRQMHALGGQYCCVHTQSYQHRPAMATAHGPPPLSTHILPAGPLSESVSEWTSTGRQQTPAAIRVSVAMIGRRPFVR